MQHFLGSFSKTNLNSNILVGKLLNLFTLPIYYILLLPHIVLYFFSKHREIIYADIESHNKLSYQAPNRFKAFVKLLSANRYYRNIFYFRIGRSYGGILNLYMPKEKSFIIDVNAIIGKGFVAFHPYSTILNVKSMGENCVIRHLSTFGNKEDDNLKIPVIKDNVVFGANVIVVGDIVINDNSVIGAGAVVTKTIPENCVVVGNPGRIIKKDGIRI